MIVLLDLGTPIWVVETVLNDVRHGLGFRQLPWQRRRALPPHVHAAASVFQRRFCLGQNRSIPTSEIYDRFQSIPGLSQWSEEEVDRTLADEQAMEMERLPVGSASVSMAQDSQSPDVKSPPSPVSVSATTERRFFEMSALDGQHGGISPIHGAESPPHLRYKKWYFRETYVDPAIEVPEIPTSPQSEVEVMSDSAANVPARVSASMSSRAELFQD